MTLAWDNSAFVVLSQCKLAFCRKNPCVHPHECSQEAGGIYKRIES